MLRPWPAGGRKPGARGVPEQDEREVGGLIPGIKYILKNYYGVDAGCVSPLSPNKDLTDESIGRRLMERFEANIYKV